MKLTGRTTDENAKVTDCYFEKKDWRACAAEVSEFCYDDSPKRLAKDELLTSRRWSGSRSAGRSTATRSAPGARRRDSSWSRPVALTVIVKHLLNSFPINSMPLCICRRWPGQMPGRALCSSKCASSVINLYEVRVLCAQVFFPIIISPPTHHPSLEPSPTLPCRASATRSSSFPSLFQSLGHVCLASPCRCGDEASGTLPQLGCPVGSPLFHRDDCILTIASYCRRTPFGS